MRRLLVTALVLAAVPWVSAQETTLFFAAAASSPGANNTFYVTDARLFNPDPTNPVTVQIAFLPANTNNTNAVEVPVTIGPRHGAALDDLVATTLQRSGSGGVRLRANRPFLATSRTYNTGDGTSGTFGQFIPGSTAAEALQQGILLQVVNDPAASGFRTNVGFLNPSSSSVTVSYKVYNAATATLLGEGSRDLQPLGFSQVNNVFSAISQANTVVENATVELTATGPVLAYASVVDNTSGDPIFVPPFADTGTGGQTNQPPDGTIVEPSGSLTAATGQTVSFVATVSDPDGDAVTGMEWDFGDGVTASGLEVVHVYNQTGTYTVTFTATDEHGLADPTPATIGATVVPVTATLSQVQLLVFTPSCAFANCHAGSNPQQGMNLSTGQSYASTVNVASHEQPALDRIEPGSPEQSYLWRKVTRDPSVSGAFMPLVGSP